MRYNMDELFLGNHSFIVLRLFIYLNPYNWRRKSNLSRAERIRLALEELGPIFVKAGQIISTRRDLLPDDIALELAKLQDRVPPFPGAQARQIVAEALSAPIESVFSTFDTNALASASIAQVHAAQLLTGEEVVVKVLRPNIRKLIARDTDLLLSMAKLADRYWPNARQFKPTEIVAEISQTLFDELDLLREGANASQLRRNFKNSPTLYIPKVYWQHCRNTILTIERIHGIPIHDLTALRAAGVDMQKLAARGIDIFFTQIFRDSFFHADLHPGNIFVDASNPKDPGYIAVDFGIVGSLSHNDKRYLAENMLAFFKRDYQRVAELHIACGWLDPDTRIDQFEGAIRSVSEPIFEQPLKDISFGKLLTRLFQVARRFHINIQPQLVLLQKTLVNIEGLCRELAPDLDIWAQATPQIERWMKEQVGVRGFWRRFKANLPLWSEQLPEIPTLLYEVLNETKQEKERQRFVNAERNLKPATTTSKYSKLLYFMGGMALASAGYALYFGHLLRL
jgi:ubiquinone biosynthesis protein